MNRDELASLLEQYNQQHILSYYDKLPQVQKDGLEAQIEQVDWRLISLIHNQSTQGKSSVYSPIKGMSIKQIENNKGFFYDIGIKAIRDGKAAAVLLAGGQGTRLGCDRPKGTVDIGITKRLYIFELLFNNILQAANEAKAYIPFFIMTSDKNHEQTVSFLKQHDFFGYPEGYITFFMQDMNPSVSFDGKLLMEAPGRLSMSPNGNGGWFSSMVKAGLLDEPQLKNVEWINVFSVDNVLQKIADPVFIGAAIATGNMCAAKVVRKTNPYERVGVMCLEDGRPSIVEYYEMADDMLHARDVEGELSYAYGVILNYLFRMDKFKSILNVRLPIHVAEKRIPHITADGQYINPDKPNGYKFEELVLDMVHLFDSCLPFEVKRDVEFAPVKNAVGDDSIDSARRLLIKNGFIL